MRDDGAALEQALLQQRLRAKQRADGVGLEHAEHVRLGRRLEALPDEHARVVDQQVDVVDVARALQPGGPAGDGLGVGGVLELHGAERGRVGGLGVVELHGNLRSGALRSLQPPAHLRDLDAAAGGGRRAEREELARLGGAAAGGEHARVLGRELARELQADAAVRAGDDWEFTAVRRR